MIRKNTPIPPKERDANFSRDHRRTSQAVLEVTLYRPAKCISFVLCILLRLGNFIAKKKLTCLAVLTRAVHSSLGMNPLRKSGLKSASLISN